MRRGAVRAWTALVVYLATAVVYPALHAEAHGRAGGADHVHVGLATVWLHDEAAAPTVAERHAHFDADLAALGLDDVAAAGTANVDCALADYTLALCDPAAASDDGAAPPQHPHTFGDELLARLHHREHAQQAAPDPQHGAGSLAHVAASFITPAPVLPAPRVDVIVRLPLAAPAAARRSAPRFTHAPRGPPVRTV
jgi:hypothetical protein